MLEHLLEEITTWSIVGPIPEGVPPQPENFNQLTEETRITPDDLWIATLAMWPSVLMPPYQISEGWLWVWYYEGDARIWVMCTVF